MNQTLNNIWLAIAVAAISISSVVSGAPPLMMCASLVGIIFVVGVSRGWVHCQAFGALLAIFIAYFSYEAGFYGNMAINVLFVLPMSLAGWSQWIRSNRQGGIKYSIKVEDRRRTSLAVALVFLICLCVSFATHAAMPIHDGLSTALLIIATFMLAVGFKEQWYFWIPYNTLEVFMWFTVASSQPEMLAVLAMRGVFLVNSLIGWVNWRKA